MDRNIERAAVDSYVPTEAGIVVAELQRAGTVLLEIARAVDGSAHLGGKIVAADDEVVTTDVIRAGTRDRACVDHAVAVQTRGPGEVDHSAGLGRKAGEPGVAAAEES